MAITVVSAFCLHCMTETEHKFLSCDECYMDFLEAGSGEAMWDDMDCKHMECLVCGEGFTV